MDYTLRRASQVALVVKHPPVSAGDTRQEGSPGQEMATLSSILVWNIPWTEELGGLQSVGHKRVRHN